MENNNKIKVNMNASEIISKLKIKSTDKIFAKK